MEGHWSYTCRTTKHLVELYRASLKYKGKKVKTNFADGYGPDLSHYDMDFFEGPSKNFNFLMDDGNDNVILF